MFILIESGMVFLSIQLARLVVSIAYVSDGTDVLFSACHLIADIHNVIIRSDIAVFFY